MLCNLVYGTMFTNYFTGQQIPPEEQAADIMDVVLHGILTGGQSHPPGGPAQ